MVVCNYDLKERIYILYIIHEKKMATVNTLPDELTNKIIMMTIPTYAFMDELKTTRFVRWGCDCEGCTEKHYYGCYYYRDFNYRLKPTNSILVLSKN